VKQFDARSFIPLNGENQPMLGLLLAIPISLVAWIMIAGMIQLFF
jgi:hypothetical protein